MLWGILLFEMINDAITCLELQKFTTTVSTEAITMLNLAIVTVIAIVWMSVGWGFVNGAEGTDFLLNFYWLIGNFYIFAMY